MSLRINSLSVFFCLTALSGCASHYSYKPSGDSAQLTVAGNTKYFFVDAYKDTACTVSEYGERLATFFGPIANTSDHELGVTVPIPTNKEFLLNFHYIDAQLALNRMCDVTVGFAPQSGAKYKAYFNIHPNVSGCSVSLTENTEGGVKDVSSAFLADNVCLGGKSLGPISGRPQRLRWEVEVIRMPIR